MRIVIATDSYTPYRSGVVRATQNQALALAGAGHEVHILAPGSEVAESPLDERIETHRLGGLGSRLTTRPIATRSGVAPRIDRLLADIAPDIVHAHTPFSIGGSSLRVAAAMGATTGLTVHTSLANAGRYLRVDRTAGRALVSHALRAAYRRPAGFAQILTAPTAFAAVHARRIVGREVYVVSNGISRLAPEDDRTERVASALNLLYVGRLSREKQVDSLIRAAASAARVVKPLELRIVGGGPDRSRLESLARTHRRVLRTTFLGSIGDDELVREFNAATAFAMPSECELECIAALEALSFGLPLAIPRAGALADLADWSGVGFTYAGAHDRSGHCGAITSALRAGQSPSIRQDARDAASARSLATVAHEWLDLYSTHQTDAAT